MDTTVMHLTFWELVNQFMQDNMTIILVSFGMMLLDIISGVIAAVINKNYSSEELRKGLGHKLGYIFVMCTVAIIQVAMFDDRFSIDFGFPLLDVVCGFIIFMEVTSIIENACLINPNLKEFVGKYFNLEKHDDGTGDGFIDLDNCQYEPDEILEMISYSTKTNDK